MTPRSGILPLRGPSTEMLSGNRPILHTGAQWAAFGGVWLGIAAARSFSGASAQNAGFCRAARWELQSYERSSRSKMSLYPATARGHRLSGRIGGSSASAVEGARAVGAVRRGSQGAGARAHRASVSLKRRRPWVSPCWSSMGASSRKPTPTPGSK